MSSYKFVFRCLFLSFALVVFTVSATFAQTTAFNFQGRLNDGGNAANGSYDFQIRLFDALAGGNQIGELNNRLGLQVINGVFSATLDFGGSAFSGGDRFLEISLRPGGTPNAFVILGARQQILAVPFAVRATNSANAENAANSQNSLSLGGVAANSYARLNFANQGDVSAANLGSNGYISIAGNAQQSANSFGFAKAMAYVSETSDKNPPAIARCYNGVTGASTPATCGFTVTEPLGAHEGVFRINFGFSVANRFAIAIPINERTPRRNFGANVSFSDLGLDVFTFESDNAEDTLPNDFLVIVY